MLYADDTPVEQMREERMVGTESRCRGRSVEENLRLWGEMFAGSEEGEARRRAMLLGVLCWSSSWTCSAWLHGMTIALLAVTSSVAGLTHSDSGPNRRNLLQA